MFIIFEVHKYRGFMVTLSGGQAMFTLWFVTFGGMACTMSEMISDIATMRSMAAAAGMFGQLTQDLHKYGGDELVRQVTEAVLKAKKAQGTQAS